MFLKCLKSMLAKITQLKNPIGSISGAIRRFLNPAESGRSSNKFWSSKFISFSLKLLPSLFAFILILPAEESVGQTVTLTVSPTTFCAGTQATLTATISNFGGGSKTYQYILNGVDIFGGSQTTSASSTTFLINNPVAGDVYTCRVTKSGTTATSGPLTVAALASPTFTVFPGANTCYNTDVTYTTQPGKTGYTWGFSGAVLNTDYTITSGSTSSNTITIKWLTIGSQTVTVNYNGTGGCGSSGAASSVTYVNAITSIPAGQPSATPQTVCQNGTATALFVTPSGSNLTYQWYSNIIASNSGGTLIASATSSSYTPSSATSGTLYYYCIVSAPCGNQTSGVSGSVTVNASPSFTTQPSSSSSLVCAVNDPGPTLSVTASPGSGSISTYDWYSNTTASNTGGTLVQGSGTNSYTPSTSAAGTLYYYCVVTNSNGCSKASAASGSVTVTLSIITQPVASQTVVAGSAASFSVVAPTSGTTYQWKKNGNPIGGATSATYNIASVVAGDAATYTVDVTNATCTPAVTSDPSVLIVVVNQPTTQASNIVFTPTASILSTSMTLNWTNGNGARRIIVGRAGGAVTHDPVDGTGYTASTVFGSGSETSAATGNYVVFDGSTAGPITVTGLLPSTNYYFRVYEYNGTGSSANYNTASATQNPNNQSTRPSTPATGINFTNVAHNSMTVNWTNGDGANRIVVARTAVTATAPTDGTVYTGNAAYLSGSILGSGYVVYNGSGNSVTVTNLNPTITYFFDVYGYAGSTSTATDKTVYLTPGLTGSQTTNPTPANSSGIIFSNVTATQMQLNWTSGTGTNRLVVAHAGAPVDSNPVNGSTVYNAGAFNSGTQIGTGNWVVYKGNSNTATITGLSTGVNYYFRIYDYTTAGSTNTYNVTTTTNNPNNQTTKPSVQASSVTFPADSANSLQLNWTNGNGARRLVVIHEGSAVNSNPVDGTSYTANSLFLSGSQIGTGNYVVYDGTGSTVTVTGLDDATTYYFRIYEYNGTNASPSTTDLKVYLTGSDVFRTTPARRDYRSINTGVWSTVGIWQTYDAKTGSWSAATKIPNKNSAITISAGNVVTINSAVASDQLTMDGSIIVGSTGSLTIEANAKNSYNQFLNTNAKLDVFGSFTIDNNVLATGHTAAKTHFYSGSTYNHESKQTEGVVPLATWDTGSTISINGFSTSITATSAGNWSQSFSNVTFNCPLAAASTVDMAGLLSTINGNLSLTNSNTGQVTLNGGPTSPTITIGGNINLSASSTLALNTVGSTTIIVGNSGTGSINVSGTSRLIVNTTGSPSLTIPNDLNVSSTNATGTSFNTSGNPIIDIDGSIIKSGAGGVLSFGSGASAGSATVNLKGNFLFTAGTVSNGSINNANFGQVNFIGGGTHTFSNAGTMSGKIHFNIASSNILDMGTGPFAGTGDFTLSANATLRVGSIDAAGALQPGTTGGNLRNSGARNFGSPSTIEYNSATAQFIGTGFPSTATVHLVNNNTSGTGLTAPATSVTLAGDFTNNGQFVHNGGTVVFAGTSNVKEIKGSVKVTFNSLTINAGSAKPDVRLESAVGSDLFNVLNVTTDTTSTFDADGILNNRIFTMLSSNDDDTRDASVATMNVLGGQVKGKVTVQRYMSKEGPVGAENIYRYISSPVQNGSAADIQNEIPIMGSFTGTSVCTGCGKVQSMFRYDETVTGAIGNGYKDFPVNINTETLAPGVGYVMLVRGTNIAGGNTSWDIRGDLNSGSVSIPVTRSGATSADGWNLVGNPFASTIDWDAASGFDKTNLDAAVYTTDNVNGNSSPTYRTYVTGASTNSASQYIASGQSFWVRANSSGTVTINENAKAAGIQTKFFREAAPKDFLRITLVKGQSRDEAVVRFKEGATPKFDRNLDAFKFSNGGINMSTITEANEFLAINSMPSFDCEHSIKISIWNVPAGTYKLDFSQFESFPTALSIILKDNFTQTQVDVHTTPSYEFAVTADVNSYGNNRFTINLSAAAINPQFVASATDVCMGSDTQVTIQGTSSAVQYFVALTDGTEIASATGNDADVILTIPKNNLTAGQNTLIVKSRSLYCSTSTYEQNVTFLVDAIPALPVVIDGKRCHSGTVTLLAKGSSNGIYNWYESEIDANPIDGAHDSTYVTPSLSKTKTYYVSAINSLGCEGPRAQVKAVVVLYDDVVITREPPDLVSSYAVGNQWFLNGVAVPGAVNQNFKPTGEGLYKVEVVIDGCSTSDEVDFASLNQSKHDQDADFSAFPNPVTTSLTITLANPNNLTVRITMTDVKGTLVVDQASKASEDGTYMVNTEALPTGVYTLHVKFGSALRTAKIIKE